MASHKQNKGSFDLIAYRKQSSTSFKAFWDRFLVKYKGSTHDKISAIGRYHLTYFFEMQMRDILSWHVDEWWQGLSNQGLSPRYLNDIMTWTKSFFKRAQDLDVIEKMPIFPKSISVPEPEVDEWLTKEEQDAIFSQLPDYDKPIFDFLFLTGSRVNEACGLKRADSDFKRGVTIIQNTVKRDGSVGVTKNKKKRRIPHTPSIKRCLLQSTVGLHIEFHFINKWGRKYHAEYLRNTFKQACIDANLKPIKLKNATRHSAGMRLLERGYDMEAVRKFYGHSSMRMTRHYAKVQEEN